ncbi:MAG: hypothetical protein IIA00_08265 [Proteobacteria bacterium]|nr:hypothetical protein [Pseudomonadota bacterium]
MIDSRSSVLVATLCFMVAAVAAPLNAQITGPLDIVPQPLRPSPAPPERAQPPVERAPVEPAPARPAPSARPTPARSSVEVVSVRAPSPEAMGLYEEAEGGYGIDMWRGTPSALVELLLPRLPAGTTSRAVNDLAARLLLSTATPPENPGGTSLLALRIERLAAMGEVEAMNALLRAAPPGLDNRTIARARLDALLLNADHVGACARARELLRRDDSPYWEKVLIFCQALAGEHDAAALGVALLRERNVDVDPAFEVLLRARAGDKDVQLGSLRNPTALHLAMLQDAELPVPEEAIASSGPAVARTVALNPNVPLETRLGAAERAEAMGALPTETLIELYENVPFMLKDLANPLSRAKASGGPMARALVYQAIRIQVVPVARAEVLRSYWRLGFASNGWAGFATAARVTLEPLLSLVPTPELAWVAGDAVRALLAAGRPAAAQPWLELAAEQAGADPEVAGAAASLWPLARLVDADGVLPWDDTRLTAWWEAQVDVPEATRRQRATVLFGLLSALGEEIPAEAQLPLLAGTLTRTAKTPVPALSRQLEAAASAGRIGETVLLALITLDPLSPEVPDILALSAAISALYRVGLVNEARALALEAALGNEL